MASKSSPSALDHAPDFRRRLIRWFRRHGRDLPWRHTRDPYRVLVSEVMLQQTQVDRVRGYYEQFLRRFPTLETLADAKPSAVREAWDGLGYYRRAANLHALARTVVGRHDGVIPSDPQALETLPGVGRYTAGAVACFAYERPTPVVDTNIARVLRRVFHPRIGNRAAAKRVWTTASRLMPKRGPSAWTLNQAMMELGALVCTARVAKCDRCPVRPVCRTGRATSTRPRARAGQARARAHR